MLLDEIIEDALNESTIQPDTSKDSLINYITSQFYKAANAPDDRKLLLLIAAISVLNSSNSNVSITAARKLAQMNSTKRK